MLPVIPFVFLPFMCKMIKILCSNLAIHYYCNASTSDAREKEGRGLSANYFLSIHLRAPPKSAKCAFDSPPVLRVIWNLVNRSCRNQKSCLLLAAGVPSGAGQFPRRKGRRQKLHFAKWASRSSSEISQAATHHPTFFFARLKGLFADLTQWDGIFARTKDALCSSNLHFTHGTKAKESSAERLDPFAVIGLSPLLLCARRWGLNCTESIWRPFEHSTRAWKRISQSARVDYILFHLIRKWELKSGAPVRVFLECALAGCTHAH